MERSIGGHVISLTTPAAEDYPSEAPIALELVFFLPRPKNVSAKEKWPSMCKPDNSNVRKAVENALTGVVWKDDMQIIHGEDDKRFTLTQFKHKPHVNIEIWKAGCRNM